MLNSVGVITNFTFVLLKTLMFEVPLGNIFLRVLH